MSTSSNNPSARSPAHLARIFQDAFDQRQATLKEKSMESKVLLHAFRDFAKGDANLVDAGENSRERALSLLQNLAGISQNLVKRKVQPQDFGPDSSVRVPRYDWSWVWQSATGSATIHNTADELSGDMYASTGNVHTEGHGSTAAAVGVQFQPTAPSAIMHVSANPSITYSYFCGRSIDSVQSDGWIGLYIGEYTLQGDFVQAIVNQKISLWMLTSDDGPLNGSNSGFPLFASVPVDNDHFYEIWVWAGVDATGYGRGVFDWSFAYADLSVHVPSISIFAYSG